MSYWSNGIVTLHNTDARKMPVESNSVHCVVTSPPYYGLRKYRADEELVIGDEATPEKYVKSIVAVFNEVYRVLRDDGIVWLNLGDSYSVNGSLVGIPWRVAFALQDNGWTLRSDVIWSKKAPMPESVVGTRYQEGVLRQGSWRSTSSHEHIFQLTKGMNYYSDGEAVKTDTQANRRDVWRDITPEPYAGEHFATFPPDLPRLCIQASTSETGVCGLCGNQWARVVEHTNATATKTPEYGANIIASRPNNPHARSNVNGSSNLTLTWKPSCECVQYSSPAPATVLDPFAGTGTTLLASQRLGRSGIGVDLSKDYLNQAIKRLSNQTLPMRLV